MKGVYTLDQYGYPLKSKAGNAMAKVQLVVEDKNGQSAVITDYLVQNAPWKLKQLVDAIGKPSLYNKGGSLDVGEITGMSGNCIVATQKSDKYEPRSVVKSYTKAPGATDTSSSTSGVAPLADDDLPF